MLLGRVGASDMEIISCGLARKLTGAGEGQGEIYSCADNPPCAAENQIIVGMDALSFV